MGNHLQTEKLQDFKGAMLQTNKYRVGKVIGKGGYGTIYELREVKNSEAADKLVVKASLDVETLQNEIKNIDRMHQYAQSQGDKYKHAINSIPKNHFSGVVQLKSSADAVLDEIITNGVKHILSGEYKLAYFAMPDYGQNLHDVLKIEDNKLADVSIFHLGIKLLDILELIHESGLVYNDLKPENIMVNWDENKPSTNYGDTSKNLFNKAHIVLVDYSLATEWRDVKTDKHCSKKNHEEFRGNLYFSSVNQLRCKTSSRRDDIQSLVFLMVYLLNSCWTECFEEVFQKEANSMDSSSINRILAVKQKLSIKKMFIDQDWAKVLEKFCNEVETIKYKSAPNYKKLKQILQQQKLASDFDNLVSCDFEHLT